MLRRLSSPPTRPSRAGSLLSRNDLSGGSMIRTRCAALPRAGPASLHGSRVISPRSRSVREGIYLSKGAVERYGTPTAWRRGFAPAASKRDGLAADGERRGGESAPKARGMERPAPLPRRVAAGNNTLAPAGRGKAATRPATRGAMQSGVRLWRPASCAMPPRSLRWRDARSLSGGHTG